VTSGAAAGRYARAIFDVALKEGVDIEKAQADLQQFVDLFAAHPVLANTLGNPAIPASKKKGLVSALVARAGSLTPVVSKVILLLAERDRLLLLPDILRIYRERVMDHQKVIRGEVTTAVPIAADRLRALEQGLQKATGRTVILESKVDPSIIGGVITRLGSTVYDGSLTTQLEKMRQSLIQAQQ
jgi:F-type H+-transporting ATPase subunit delta